MGEVTELFEVGLRIRLLRKFRFCISRQVEYASCKVLGFCIGSILERFSLTPLMKTSRALFLYISKSFLRMILRLDLVHNRRKLLIYFGVKFVYAPVALVHEG